MRIPVYHLIDRIAYGLFDRPKSDEEQLARAVFRIIKDKSKKQGVNPRHVIDYLEQMKEKIKGLPRG